MHSTRSVGRPARRRRARSGPLMRGITTSVIRRSIGPGWLPPRGGGGAGSGSPPAGGGGRAGTPRPQPRVAVHLEHVTGQGPHLLLVLHHEDGRGSISHGGNAGAPRSPLPRRCTECTAPVYSYRYVIRFSRRR